MKHKKKTSKKYVKNKSRRTKKNYKLIKGGNSVSESDELYDKAMIEHQKKQMNNSLVCNVNKKINSGIIFDINNKQQTMNGGGTKIDWIYDFTDKLYNEFKKISGFTNLKTLSIFNPSVTWVQDEGNKSIYCCTSRCIYYDIDEKVFINEKINEYHSSLRDKIRFFDQNPDIDDNYVIYPGNIFNKWITPGGFWGAIPECNWNDMTMLTIIERVGDKINFVFSKLINYLCDSSPIDARVFNIFNNISTPTRTGTNVDINTVYVTGSSTRIVNYPPKENVIGSGKRKTTIDPECNYRSNSICERYNGPLQNSNDGWKQSLSRIQILKHGNNYALAFPHQSPRSDRNPFDTKENCTQESLANCISWNNNTEKNYALYYYNYDDSKRRFCSNKCMILNYMMTGLPSNKNPEGGIVFYYKEFDSTVDKDNLNEMLDGKQFETELDTSWKTIQPRNSDIFSRICKKYEMCELRVSCTTPFISLGNSLIAVGHFKLDIFTYLNYRLQEAHSMFGSSYNKIKSYYQGNTVDGHNPGKRDHLFNYGLSLIEWAKTNIINNSKHGFSGDKKYLCEVIDPDNWPSNFRCYTYLLDSNSFIRDFLVSERFINKTANGYITMRNLHPLVVYFMFFYKINANTLDLESFSHPFMILKNENCSFLNFPMGITTNHRKNSEGEHIGEKHIWLSYGEGDCQCYIAAFKESQLNDLINKNNNDTNLDNIEFWSYKEGDI